MRTSSVVSWRALRHDGNKCKRATHESVNRPLCSCRRRTRSEHANAFNAILLAATQQRETAEAQQGQRARLGHEVGAGEADAVLVGTADVADGPAIQRAGGAGAIRLTLLAERLVVPDQIVIRAQRIVVVLRDGEVVDACPRNEPGAVT